MNQVTIDLIPPEDTLESYEIKDENVVQLRVHLNGETIVNPKCRVEIRLSRDAMLGLGISLIRAGYKQTEENDNFWHLRPSERGLAVKTLGIYLHPDSCELLVTEINHGTLESLIVSRDRIIDEKVK
jgi:hypothetical protein